MNKPDELIQQYCPDGVTIVPLGEVAPYAKTRIDASEMNENNYVGVLFKIMLNPTGLSLR